MPERSEVRVRYAGAYATRRRVWWRRRGVVLVRTSDEPPEAAAQEESWPALRARRRRWAELMRLVFKVDVEVCARCGGEARIIGFVTEPKVIQRILAHLERPPRACRFLFLSFQTRKRRRSNCSGLPCGHGIGSLLPTR